MPITHSAQTVARWKAADSLKPGTPGYAAGQAGLEAWITGQVQAAVESGQLDPADRGALTGLLATLGVTPEKGGGRYLFNKLMGNHGGPSIGARLASSTPAATGSPVHQAGRQALMQKYGATMAAPAARGSYAGGSFGQVPTNWSDWGSYGLG